MGLKIGTKELTDEDSTTVCCTSDGRGGGKRLRELFRRVMRMERDFPGAEAAAVRTPIFQKLLCSMWPRNCRFTLTKSRISRCASAGNNGNPGVHWLMQTKVLEHGAIPERDVSNSSGYSSQKSQDLDKIHDWVEIEFVVSDQSMRKSSQRPKVFLESSQGPNISSKPPQSLLKALRSPQSLKALRSSQSSNVSSKP